MIRSVLTLIVSMLIVCCYTAQAQSPTILKRIILVGDAGELHENDHNPVIDAVRKTFDLQDDRNVVIFLGDNVYPRGVPDSLSDKYPIAKEILDYQINLVKGTNATGFIIPGNHDWDKSKPDGLEIIKNQQRYVDSLHLSNFTFLPKDGCPGPMEVHISNDITLIIMDSEWWVFPYKKPGLESSCDCKDNDEILTKIGDIAAANRNKFIIFATHHPFRSYGIHGGYYTIKQHIFPLTDLKPYLYIPLPVIGSIYPIARGVFGTPEDIPHPKYQAMIKGVENALKPHGPVVFVSGHDHTLQLIKDNDNDYIVSGSGAKNNRVHKGPKSLYATTENGFSAIELLSDSTLRVNYYVAEKGTTPTFSNDLHKIQEKQQKAVAFVLPSQLPAYIRTVADSQYVTAGKFHRWILGDNYREVWATPLNFPVMNLATEKGGLKIIQRGGGKQTRSLRLEDSTGTEYVLRSLKKYPLAAIPEQLRETIAKEVVQDQISAANPYAPLAVSVLAEAAGVPHTHPTFVYLPRDTALGLLANDFGNDVYLFEEREPVMGNSEKTYNTPKVIDKITGDNDERVDQKDVLKARVLDMYIMDFDRHDDQWRWYREKHKGIHYYSPVPRDRDQAFFLNQGLIPRQASRRWILPAIQGFRDKIPDINGFNFSTRYFDRSFLNELDEKDWKKQTEKFLGKMTDSVIQAAVNAFPDSVKSQVGPMMLHTLSVRRNILEENVMKYYRFISKGVDIPATEKTELITVDKLSDGKVALNINKISKKGEIQQNIYSRTFDPGITKEVNVYGLGGGDKFVVKGDHATPIRVRLIGGAESDTYIDSTNTIAGKRIRIYDMKNGKDTFLLTGNEQRRLSSDPANIKYIRNSYQYDKLFPMIAAGYNRDDGVLLGLGVSDTRHAWRREPFSTKHLFTATHALATRAWNFRYQGEYTDVIGKTDLLVFASAKAPNNVINFFGFGNETVFDRSNGRTISYYRARFNMYTAEGLLRTRVGDHFNIKYGPTFNYYALDKDENSNNFLSDFEHNGLDSVSIFKNKFFAGAKVSAVIDTRNNILIPTRGVLWTTTFALNRGLESYSYNTHQLTSDLSLYMSLTDPANVVLVTRFGGGKIWGNYEYFQAMTIGGIINLRGFRNYRFSGDAMAYNNTEIRVKLFDINAYLFPATVGVLAFNDVGRVWKEGEQSRVWHDGFGGGIYVAPINALIVTASLGHSREETLGYFSLGFRF